MHCYVPFCENSSETLGITFHNFPSTCKLRTAWLSALAKQECHLPQEAVVCSQHFHPEDFSVARGGSMKLRSEAVPFVMYELELFDQKPVDTNKHAGSDIQKRIDNIVIKNEDARSTIDVNNTTLIKQEPLDHASVTVEPCCKGFESFLEVSKHELNHNSLGTEHLSNNDKQEHIPVEAILSTNSSPVPGASLEESYVEEDCSDAQTQHCMPSSYITPEATYTTDLVSHMSRIVEKPFTCNICNHKSLNSSALKKHLRIHSGEKAFACNICDYRSVDKSTLIRHMKTHTGEKPFTCNVCNYKCSRLSNLKTHMRAHTAEKPYTCNVCGYKCSRTSHMKTHMRLHTGEKPFTCNVCDYRSGDRSAVIRHMRTHAKDKPFACNICDYKTVDKSTLGRHMKTHTGEKPFICNVCDYKSAYKSAVLRHMKTHKE